MAASVELTRGAVTAIVGVGAEGTKPVVQVLGLRLLNVQSAATERYSLRISDGAHFVQALLAPKHNALVKTGLLQSRSVVMLKDFILEGIHGRRLIILVDLEVLVKKSDLIGDPKLYTSFSETPRNQASMPKTKTVEIESKINELRKQLLVGMDKMDTEYRKQILQSAKDSQAQEQELADEWAEKHMKLIKFFEQINQLQPQSQPQPPTSEIDGNGEVPPYGS